MNVCSTTVNLINLRLGVVKELLRSTDFEKCIGVYQSKNLYTSSSSPNRSDCLESQELVSKFSIHGLLVFAIAFKIVTILRMHATNATFFFLPCASNLS